MKKFNVEITETLQRTIEVLAEDECDAIDDVAHGYKTGKIILSDELTDVNFDLFENNIAKINDEREFYENILQILSYLWKDELKHFEEMNVCLDEIKEVYNLDTEINIDNISEVAYLFEDHMFIKIAKSRLFLKKYYKDLPKNLL
ncbi:hypothetical protein FACS1894193_02780 [Bacilli bacterium]|nr:hypothetical protein FACS1894192_08810 [Bacilli bacterium]GHU40469.1 hypothetical protein FACS1894193_02780 [Bacilli bacterium]